jgi:phosphoribosylformylglycinamidine synthase
MRARVFVTLKPSVFDPQGTVVTDALHTLGHAAVQGVRQGKYFELDIQAASADEARQVATRAAEELLANTVIESYRIEVDATTDAQAVGVRPAGTGSPGAGPAGARP